MTSRAMHVLVACALLPGVLGHGSMNTPPPRNNGGQTTLTRDASCLGDACYWYQVGCFNGCDACTSTGKELYPSPGCAVPMEPTNNAYEARSHNRDGKSVHGDWTKYNPWRAPGHAPVVDPCGDAGGTLPGTGTGKIPEGYHAFDRGSKVLPEVPGLRTVWKAGGTAEVAWAIAANHAGGYSYRLCPKGRELTEECFQSHPLKFAPRSTTIRYNDGSREFEVPTVTISNGTSPEGSQWRRNPIPMCNCDLGFGCGAKGEHAISEHHKEHFGKLPPEALTPYTQGKGTRHCPTGTQFPAPFDEFGQGFLVQQTNEWSIVDKVEVPNTPGDYVLSWRWDCEQTDQVWSNCADVTISMTEPPSPRPRPAPADSGDWFCFKGQCKEGLGHMTLADCDAMCALGEDFVI